MYPYKTKFEYCIFSYVQLYAFQYKKAGIPSFEDDCFCPLASSAPLRRLLFHLLGFPLCHPAFTILSFSLFSDIYRPAFRCLPLRHPADSALPSDVCYFVFRGLPPLSNTCYSTFWFAVPSFIICYSPFRHLLFRLLFSFCGHSFKNPPTYAHA